MSEGNERPTRVRRVGERIRRREMFRRGGAFGLAAAAAPWLLGVPAAEALHGCEPASAHCGAVGAGCSCSGATCHRGDGTRCRERFGECQSGGQCWVPTCNPNIRCCDWWCNGERCHCCKQRDCAPTCV